MAGVPPAVPVDFEDAAFDSAEVQRHDVLLAALDHLLSRTYDEIDRLHDVKAANLDAIDAVLSSALTGIDMLYVAREPTPISGTSIAHASWWAEDAPVPCDSETWLRAAIPEGQRSETSFAMEQFLKAQATRSNSRPVSRAGSAHSSMGGGAGSRPGTGSKQQRARSPASTLTPILSPSAKSRPRGPPSPDTVRSVENGLREELEIRRAQVAVARELEVKDAAERERLSNLQKQLKGRDYSYDHKGQVVVLHPLDPASGPDSHAPSFRLAPPETGPLSPNRSGSVSGAAAPLKKQATQALGKGTKEKKSSNDYRESKSTSQPNALETMNPTPGVTLRQGNQMKSGPAPKRGGQGGTNMTREEFERFAAQKAQQAQLAALQQAHGAALERAAAAAAAAGGVTGTPSKGSGLGVSGGERGTPRKLFEGQGSRGTAGSRGGAEGPPRSAGGTGVLASVPDTFPTAFGGTPKLTPLPTPVATTRPVPPDVNPALVSAPDWGVPGSAGGYDPPAALPIIKPNGKLRELEVGRDDRMPRVRASQATISPPRTKPPAKPTGAAARW